jgi:hypothetical protein
MAAVPGPAVPEYLLITVVLPKAPERVEVSYTFFKQQVQADNVVEISTRTDTIQGTFKNPVAYQPNGGTSTRTAADVSTVIPAFADPGLESLRGSGARQPG